MPIVEDWSITKRPESDKSFFLVYQEPSSHLDLHFEVASIRHGYDWVGITEAFTTWTIPDAATIPLDHGRTIRDRVESWARQRDLYIGFEPLLRQRQNDRIAATLRRSRVFFRIVAAFMSLTTVVSMILGRRVTLLGVIFVVIGFAGLAYSYRPISGIDRRAP